MTVYKIMIVDRDAKYREWMRHHLGVQCPTAAILALGVDQFRQRSDSLTRKNCDLLVLAASFGNDPDEPRSEGIEWLEEFRDRRSFPAVIAVADDGNELTAVRALQLGAVDYLPKRLLTGERLKAAVARALASLDVGASASMSVSMRAISEYIPGYVIKRTIGESEKAIVYLATSEALGRDVALKVEKARAAGDGDDEEQGRLFFAREYAAISAIRHPAIVEIYDYGMHEGREYLAMQYFPRGDLKARLQQGMDEADALRYLGQIACALKVIHDAGLLHRDLKPPNVMLTEGDDIVLIDFGLARNVAGTIHSTRTGVLRGSPYYMSPEQALGEPLDARTDLYSLGIIFYEMLTGRKPYTGTSAIEVLQQHVHAPLPQLPEELAHCQQILDALLAKSPDDRFQNADQVIEAVAGMRELRTTAA